MARVRYSEVISNEVDVLFLQLNQTVKADSHVILLCCMFNSFYNNLINKMRKSIDNQLSLFGLPEETNCRFHLKISWVRLLGFQQRKEPTILYSSI